MGKNKDDVVKKEPDDIVGRGIRVGLTEDQIAEALRLFKGMPTKAAEFLRCNPSNLYYRIKRSPYLQEIIHECKEGLLDEAELKLHELIQDRHFNAIWKYLTTHGKHRGYIENNMNQISPEMVNKFLDSMRVIQQIQDLQSTNKTEANNNINSDMS